MKKIALSLLMLFSIPTLASSATGTIGKVEMGPAYGHLVFISIKGSVSSQPTCHQNTSYNYVLDTNEAGQNATLSAILAAKASGQTVSISGYSQCVRYPDVEGLRWLRLED